MTQGSTPNLLVVLVDQLRAEVLDGPGGDPVSTPCLDALVARGVRCPQATTSYPVCSPSRAMFLSGRSPWRNGVPDNVNSARAPGVGVFFPSR